MVDGQRCLTNHVFTSETHCPSLCRGLVWPSSGGAEQLIGAIVSLCGPTFSNLERGGARSALDRDQLESW